MGLYLIIVLFFCLYIFYLECRYRNAFTNIRSEYLIKIISIKEEGDYKDKYTAKVLDGKDKNFKISLYVDKVEEYKYGDILKVSGEIELPDKARNDKRFWLFKVFKN